MFMEQELLIKILIVFQFIILLTIFILSFQVIISNNTSYKKLKVIGIPMAILGVPITMIVIIYTIFSNLKYL